MEKFIKMLPILAIAFAVTGLIGVLIATVSKVDDVSTKQAHKLSDNPYYELAHSGKTVGLVKGVCVNAFTEGFRDNIHVIIMPKELCQ